MLRAYRNILEKIKKNGFSFYCLPAVLCLSACCGFVFSVTVQAVSFVALVVCAAVIVTKNKFKNIELLFVFLPLAAVFLSYLGADFQANVRDASLGLVNAAL
ncbi:MAG: hypothetical protein LBL00_03075, partial [Endomicrobium sp.]|nr:hypothetical protein [Endomicrobium sp.]